MVALTVSQRLRYMNLPSFRVPWRDLAIVAALFAASRVLYALLGLQFDASTVPGYMQFIDPQLLRTRLLESIWYYHANPPMLNLVVGVGYKLFGAAADAFFSLVFHALGLALALTVYLLTWKLSGARLAGHIAAALLVFSPSFVLYENWLMYTFPSAALLTISALALYRYVQTRQTRWCALFFSVLTLLLLTRSLFHVAWMVLVAALLAVSLRDHWRQVLTAAALPILVVALWYGKNYYYFGVFSGSTWMGLGLSNISTLVATREELQPLVDDGRLTRFALMSRYKQMDELFTSQQLPPTGIPVLDQVRKSTGPYNFNNQQLIAVSRDYARDAITVIRTYPFSYVVGLIISNRLFFSPTSMNIYFSEQNRTAARGMESVFNPLLYAVGGTPRLTRQPHFGFKEAGALEVNTSVVLILMWPLVLGYGYMQARRAVISQCQESMPRALTMGFIVVTALYVYVVGTGLELAENYRYRFLIEPLFLVLQVAAATALLRVCRDKLQTMRRGASATV